MRVCTPIADLEIAIERLAVEDGALVMTNARDDAIATRAIIGPRDMRKLLGALFRPSIIWFAIACLFRPERGVPESGGSADEHPTPNPW